LPVLDAGRTEFGWVRTQCACPACVAFCRHVSGYLIPADQQRLRQQFDGDADFIRWASGHLLASPGALVVRGGRLGRIPTVVPARRADGSCVFLTPEHRCAIHALAPYGCAFFDAHQPADEADRRSCRGLRAILEDWWKAGPYAELWIALHAAGLVAPAPELARRPLAQSSPAARASRPSSG
jgi:hypothetical protein